jgi:hypothetical protein
MSIICILAALISLATLSSSSILFREEQKKIMSACKSIKYTPFEPKTMAIVRLPLESMLAMDAITFFEEMQSVEDDCFLIIFWHHRFTFSTYFAFPKSYFDLPAEFIKQIIRICKNRYVVNQILNHFKVYLTEKFFGYSVDEKRAELLNKAMSFFNIKLRSLIEKLQASNESQFKAMKRNFLFYQKCIPKEGNKSILISEFFKLKSALELDDTSQIGRHSENLTFLANALAWDKASIFGLKLIWDQPPDFIGYFMLIQKRQFTYLNEWAWSIRNVKLHDYLLFLLRNLFAKFPIFEQPNNNIIPKRFRLLPDFKNNYREIMDERELIHLTKSLFDKILLL